MITELQARTNAVLDKLPSSFIQDTPETLAHLASIGLTGPLARHVMGFGGQLGVYHHLALTFPDCYLSSESRDEQWFDIDAFGDRQVCIDVKCRTAGKPTWTISKGEFGAKFPAVMIYAFYTCADEQYVLESTMVRVRGEDTNFVLPQPSQFNEGFFWYAKDLPKGNTGRFE